MGRMADILRKADRSPGEPPEPTPKLVAPPDPAPDADTEADADPEVPFIEVGGPRQPPVLRLLPGPPSRPPQPPPPDGGRGGNGPPGDSGSHNPPPPPGLFTIRFQPVHPA